MNLLRALSWSLLVVLLYASPVLAQQTQDSYEDTTVITDEYSIQDGYHGHNNSYSQNFALTTQQAKAWGVVNLAALSQAYVNISEKWPFAGINWILGTLTTLQGMPAPTNSWHVVFVPATAQHGSIEKDLSVPQAIYDWIPTLRGILGLLLWLVGTSWLVRAFTGFDASKAAA